ncbi:MAG: hybrid sensor histidine kinase/response regulator [Rhodobacteraceae bacterium PARR1]|nr:MAG: hybrid sensor histidine kinase/response regulator [Rhodobacteraceae bacterium PARR1]
MGMAVAGLILAALGFGFVAPHPVLTSAGLALALLPVAVQVAGMARPGLSDARLHQVISGDPVPGLVTDRQGRVLFTNPRADAILPPAPDGTPRNPVAVLPGLLQAHFANPRAVVMRLHARAASDGSAREDVSSREGTLRLSVHRLRVGRFLWRIDDFKENGTSQRGAEGLSLPMLTVNRQGVVLFANDAMRRLLGERPRRLDRLFKGPPAKHGEVVTINAVAGPVRARLAEVAGPGERREIYLLPVEEAPSPDSGMLFDGLPVALMRFDAAGVLIAANRAARDLSGLTDTAILTRRMADLFDGPGRPMQDWLQDVLHDRRPGTAEVVELHSAEPGVFVHLSLRRMAGPLGPEVLAVLQDATALKRMEAQYVQSQKMQAIGQLAGGIAHDFNNLLTAISGHCDLLLLRRRPEDADWPDLIQISQNSNRAAALVSQLLAFSRKQTMKPERIELEEALGDLTHLLNRLVGERIDLRLTQDPKVGPLRADRRQLDQVIMNLVVNARDAMPEGGIIRIDTQDVHLAEDRPRGRVTLPAGRYALIRVRDDGIGIPEDRLEKIFEPFYTTKRPGEGTGLGLSTVYGIVKQSAGFVFVDSTPGLGSTFEVWFPVHDLPANDAVVVPTKPLSPKRKAEGVVLLVEDEAPVRAFASRALRLKGHTVLEAGTAEEALTLLKDPRLQVDIFVTDVVMPGMDGPTWVMQALETRPDVRVVFVSGYSEDCLSDAQGQVPNSIFLPKPFSLSELTTTVQAQLAA